MASLSVFGVTGGATGVTEKQIFTFTKSGAVPIGTASIKDGIFQLNTSLNKKTYFNSVKIVKSAPSSKTGITEKEITLPELASLGNDLLCSSSPAPNQYPTPIGIDTRIHPAIKTANIDYQSDPEHQSELTTIDPVNLDIHDDGYHSTNSPSPSSHGEEEEETMEVDFFDLDKDKTEKMLGKTIQYTEEPIEYVQEFLVDNIIDTDGLDFQLITEESNGSTGYTSDDSSESYDDLSSKLIDAEKDPTWHPQEYELKKVAVFDNQDLHQALFPEDKKLANKKVKSTKKKTIIKYKKGPKPMNLDKIDDEDKKKNIIRCREYRCKKTETVLDEMTELEMLEERNEDLKIQEQAVKDKVKKIKDTYIKLISEGRVKFC